MTRQSLIGFVISLLIVASAAQADTLDGLRSEHPRLMATAADFERIRQLVKQDPLAKRWYEKIRRYANDRLLKEPAAEFEIPDGMRMRVAGNMNARALTLGLLHQIEPDPRYKQRLWEDAQAVANFPSWNPAHFLDVGGMAFNVAIIYDWLYDEWTPEQRRVMVDAIVKHGLKPGIEAHANGRWWTKTTNNWNQVIHGGMIAAALAIADQEPEVATEWIDLAVKALPLSMNRYAPDGGYEEGSAYWGYGTRYNVYGLASLNTALGHDFGLGEIPGLSVTSQFVQHATSPTGIAFNYGDGSPGRTPEPIHFYFAKRYGDLSAARYQMQYGRGTALDLLWYDPALLKQEAPPVPLDAHYPNAGIVTLRSAWGDDQAAYLGVKGGKNGISHSQLDLGTFIYENKGVRWFIDFGRDDYNLPGYFRPGRHGQRWQYYRNRAEGHNTLVLNPSKQPDQVTDGEASLAMQSDAGGARVKVDLSSAYELPATRTFVFERATGQVTLTDTLELAKPTELWWFAHTQAQVTLGDDGRSATLTRDGETLHMKLLEPNKAKFTLLDAVPLPTSPQPEGQNPNNGAKRTSRTATGMTHVSQRPQYGEPDPKNATRKLAIHMEAVSGPLTIRCMIEP